MHRTKEIMYWTGMSSEIKHYIETCGTYATYHNKQAAEESIISSVPPLPWERVGVDICSYGNRDYLITIYYHSNFFEFDLLPDFQVSTMIVRLDAQFEGHGFLSSWYLTTALSSQQRALETS